MENDLEKEKFNEKSKNILSSDENSPYKTVNNKRNK